MARHCHKCRSTDVQEAGDRWHCLECGAFTFQDESKAPGKHVWTSEIPDSAKEYARVARRDERKQ